MSNIIITNIQTRNRWKLTRNDVGVWEAFIIDPEDPETGAPFLRASVLDELITKIEIFEQGADYGN